MKNYHRLESWLNFRLLVRNRGCYCCTGGYTVTVSCIGVTTASDNQENQVRKAWFRNRTGDGVQSAPRHRYQVLRYRRSPMPKHNSNADRCPQNKFPFTHKPLYVQLCTHEFIAFVALSGRTAEQPTKSCPVGIWLSLRSLVGPVTNLLVHGTDSTAFVELAPRNCAHCVTSFAQCPHKHFR